MNAIDLAAAELYRFQYLT